ncbi:hypothetical protein [Nostoc sp.]|uniref:hypothetical protein n=1 Tax=Nostoc sp. TaxID=1180 RepID=UPI002FF66413
MSNNQNILEGLGLIEELDEQAGETITGGAQEVFTVTNKTKYDITYFVDGTSSKVQKPGQGLVWTTYKGGIIKFDTDGRKDYVVNKSYNLADGKKYEFQDDKSTAGNPYDINLYSVG